MNRIKTLIETCKDKGLSQYLETAVTAALEAGKILRSLYERPHQITHKGTIDLVTEADIASEKKVLEICQAALPVAKILAEESTASYGSFPYDLVWIIDPLDGTTNFAHGFPWFCTSIALANRAELLIGVIYSPILDELFYGIRGEGAWLNDRPINVSRVKELSQALLATGFPYDVQENPDQVVAALKEMLVKAQGVRRAGAAALDLAYVACGRLDGFWEVKLKPWDTAAGQLILEEASGMISDFKGQKYDPFVPEILASNGLIHKEMAKILKSFGIR